MAKKNVFQPKTEEEREFKKVIESIDYRKNSYEVFTDWIQCCALAYAQVSHYTDEKEERYKNIMNKYSEEDRHKFAELMAILIRAYTNKDGSAKFGDILGDIYMACGFGNSAQGQFFTPYSICQLMAETIPIKEDMRNKVITVADMAVGGGALPIAYAEHLFKNKINYQKDMLLYATDISINSVCMCMIQCSLLGIPAIITHGNALTNEVWEVWETPMVSLNLVKVRLAAQNNLRKITTTEEIINECVNTEVKQAVETHQLQFNF